METCEVCKADLGKFDTIWAAEGKLYCSERCGISVLHDNFYALSEEIAPSDIGIQGKMDVLIEYIMLSHECDYELASIVAHDLAKHIDDMIAEAVYEGGA